MALSRLIFFGIPLPMRCPFALCAVSRDAELLIEIREECPEDVAAIRDVNTRAFSQDQEGNIVDALRSNGSKMQGASGLAKYRPEFSTVT